MKPLMILVTLTVIAIVLIKLRADASKQRKAVMSRLATEQAEGAFVSPTALLFQEVGVPVPSEYAELAATPSTPAAHTATSTPSTPPPPPPTQPAPPPPSSPSPSQAPAPLRERLGLPEDLEPVDDLGAAATYRSRRAPDEVRAELLTRFARPGCTTTWLDEYVVRVNQQGAVGVIAVTAEPEGCLVRLTSV